MNDNFISVTWSEVRDDFYKLNSELAEIIDELSPTKAFRLYKARYPFGSEYVQLGKFFLPNENGDLVSLTSHTVPQQVRDDLSYNLGSHPVSFILNKSVEIYMPLPNRTTPVPHALVPKGYIFSTSVVLQEGHQLHHPAFLWSISAGSRSIFMLPKISKTKNYRRMQYKYGYNAVPPGNSFKHWDLFKDLYQHKLLGEWNLEIIFFSKKWFEQLQEK